MLLPIVLKLALATLTLASTCPQTCNRKEIHDLTDTEWQSFATAFMKLSTLDVSGHSPLDTIARDHSIYYTQAHASAQFLPWHRKRLYDFEKLLQSIDGSICIPYWDSSAEAMSPQTSSIWVKLGSPRGVKTCITDGLFTELTYTYNTDLSATHAIKSAGFCLARVWESHYIYPTQVLTSLIQTAGLNYSMFELTLELAHAGVHFDNSDVMLTMASPVDPLFWLHHAYIDKVWGDFQSVLKAGGADQYGGVNPAGGVASLKDIMVPFEVNVGSVIDMEGLCYWYAERGAGGASTSSVVQTITTTMQTTTTIPTTTIATISSTTTTTSTTSGEIMAETASASSMFSALTTAMTTALLDLSAIGPHPSSTDKISTSTVSTSPTSFSPTSEVTLTQPQSLLSLSSTSSAPTTTSLQTTQSAQLFQLPLPIPLSWIRMNFGLNASQPLPAQLSKVLQSNGQIVNSTIAQMNQEIQKDVGQGGSGSGSRGITRSIAAEQTTADAQKALDTPTQGTLQKNLPLFSKSVQGLSQTNAADFLRIGPLLLLIVLTISVSF